MNKTELIKKVANEAKTSTSVAGTLLDKIFDEIKKAVASDDSVKLRGFGVFKKRHCKEKNGFNPRTKKLEVIPEHNTPTFKPSISFREVVN